MTARCVTNMRPLVTIGANMRADFRRAIPSVNALVQELGCDDVPHAAAVALVRRELARIRRTAAHLTPRTVLDDLRSAMEKLRRGRLQTVINATGVLVHTNLGRAPLARQVVSAIGEIAANYNNLEYDLHDGRRSERAAYLEHNLAVLCQGQAATVVNNCAAALVLALRHFATGNRNEVIISRGELVQIGGGFRIPEILEASGATLREVGATNKTSLADYSRAISKRTGLILKVHRSNFYMDGFVESPATRDLAELARRKRIPILEDLGSGATFATDKVAGLEHEPTPAEVLGQGVDLVCFSGDKLLGGPQAGVIAGRATMVAALKREPFFRALRCDKLILSALQATVDLHLSNERSIPVVAMLHESSDELRVRAESIAAQLREIAASANVVAARAQIGGGTLPRSTIASVALEIVARDLVPAGLAAKLRAGSPPVVGYVSANAFRVDLRTVFPRQDGQLVAAIHAALT